MKTLCLASRTPLSATSGPSFFLLIFKSNQTIPSLPPNVPPGTCPEGAFKPDEPRHTAASGHLTRCPAPGLSLVMAAVLSLLSSSQSVFFSNSCFLLASPQLLAFLSHFHPVSHVPLSPDHAQNALYFPRSLVAPGKLITAAPLTPRTRHGAGSPGLGPRRGWMPGFPALASALAILST